MRETNDVLVSVICTTYNQEKYIEKALNSILNQKTSFKYEIIIHDDASTDNTEAIIKEYEKRYPDIIHAIYQKENQYSKGVLSDYKYIYPVAKGKYHAICEGDDYWTDDIKLEKQVQYMELHPECMLTAHSGDYCYEDGVLTGNEFRPFFSDQIVSMEDICSRWLFPTASIVYRATLRNNIIPFTKNAPCGDVPLVMYAALHGTVYYMDAKMCVYRRGAKYSLTTQWKKNKQVLISVNLRFISMLDQFDEYTNYQYSESIDLFRKSKEYNNLILQNDIKTLQSSRYYEYYGISIKRKLITCAKIYLPHLSNFIIAFIEMCKHYKCYINHKAHNIKGDVK